MPDIETWSPKDVIPLKCAVCESEIKLNSRCYVVSICRALVAGEDSIGPFGGWGGVVEEPVICATCMGDAVEALECLQKGYENRRARREQNDIR